MEKIYTNETKKVLLMNTKDYADKTAEEYLKAIEPALVEQNEDIAVYHVYKGGRDKGYYIWIINKHNIDNQFMLYTHGIIPEGDVKFCNKVLVVEECHAWILNEDNNTLYHTYEFNTYKDNDINELLYEKLTEVTTPKQLEDFCDELGMWFDALDSQRYGNTVKLITEQEYYEKKITLEDIKTLTDKYPEHTVRYLYIFDGASFTLEDVVYTTVKKLIQNRKGKINITQILDALEFIILREKINITHEDIVDVVIDWDKTDDEIVEDLADYVIMDIEAYEKFQNKVGNR